MICFPVTLSGLEFRVSFPLSTETRASSLLLFNPYLAVGRRDLCLRIKANALRTVTEFDLDSPIPFPTLIFVIHFCFVFFFNNFAPIKTIELQRRKGLMSAIQFVVK